MSFKHTLSSLWYQKHWSRWLMAPFSLLYRLVILLRKSFYRFGVFKVTQVAAPVIIVGNISVGGTGKSPLTAALAMRCRQLGLRPGLVSRGYGGKAKQWPQFVAFDSDPYLVGDEPVMLVQQTGCPMMVGPDRVAAAQALLAEHVCDVIISDDGLQHYALGRDMEIVVLDGQRRHGNGYCLPAGPLREPLSRLQQVDFLVCHGDAISPEFQMQLQLQAVTQLIDQTISTTFDKLRETPVHAIAGIGFPERFFKALEQQGLRVIRHAFPDHHQYAKADIDFSDNYPVLMTAKDAVKCRELSESRHWCVMASAVCSDAFWQAIDIRLGCLIR